MDEQKLCRSFSKAMGKILPTDKFCSCVIGQERQGCQPYYCARLRGVAFLPAIASRMVWGVGGARRKIQRTRDSGTQGDFATICKLPEIPSQHSFFPTCSNSLLACLYRPSTYTERQHSADMLLMQNGKKSALLTCYHRQLCLYRR